MQLALSLIARLRKAGAKLEYVEGCRVRFSAVEAIPATLLAEARQHREAISQELAAEAQAVSVSTASESGTTCAQGVDADALAHDAAPLVDRPVRYDKRLKLLHSEVADWHPRLALLPPPSWWHVDAHTPCPGATCSCCGGVRWWSRDGKGWCCQTCHPKIGLTGSFIEFNSEDELRDRIAADDLSFHQRLSAEASQLGPPAPGEGLE
jgi:hypothetical protein